MSQRLFAFARGEGGRGARVVDGWRAPGKRRNAWRWIFCGRRRSATLSITSQTLVGRRC